MGMVRYRSDRNTWFIDYIAADGRRMREAIGPGEDNKRLARKILAQREAEAQLGQHRIAPARTMRLGDFADDWLKRCEARGLRSKTLEAYRGAVDNHLRAAFGEVRLGALTRRSIEAYLADKWATGTRPGRKGQPRRRYSPSTINAVLRVLKQMLGDAVDLGYLADNPAARVRPLRSPDHDGHSQLHALTPAEIARLLEAASEPYRTLYHVATHTGLRRGELLGLRWWDLDLSEGVLHVRRSLGRVREGDGYAVREAPLKTRNALRTIDLSPRTVQMLLALPAGDDPERDYVFRSQAGGPIDPDNLDRAFKRHLTLAGLPEVRVHDLRHTHASLLVAAGVHPKAIQARLGHASITTTLDVYGHMMPSAFAGVGERLDTLLAAGRQRAEAIQPLVQAPIKALARDSA